MNELSNTNHSNAVLSSHLTKAMQRSKFMTTGTTKFCSLKVETLQNVGFKINQNRQYKHLERGFLKRQMTSANNIKQTEMTLYF